MRDNKKSKEYFDAFVAEDEQRIQNFNEKLLSGSISPDRVMPVTTLIHDIKLGILIAKYSRGDSVGSLRDDFIALVETWKDVYMPDFYSKGLWMISLCVLFDVNNDLKQGIIDMVENSNITDWLYSFLLTNGKKQDLAETNLLFPKAYQYLKKIVIENNVNENTLSDYLRRWYQHHKSCGWYDAHKCQYNIYYGYWSFEAGAVAKICGVDDSSLNTHQYYPYDLVHFSVEK